jgi:mRNA interferase RelE/StbE
MKVLVDRSFERDIKKLPQPIQVKIKFAIEVIIQATNLSILQATKMEGAKNAYRIRVGDYRIGFYLEGEVIVLSRALNRKEIYRYFPKK